MLVTSAIGTFSVVASPEHPRALVVRALTRADLTSLRSEILPDLQIEETPDAEHRYRAVVARDEWAHALETLAQQIDYDEFEPPA